MLGRALLIGLCLATGVVIAAPVERRAVIAHDAVVGFAETVPSGTVRTLYLKYKPFLLAINGCVPFPAVDASGNTRTRNIRLQQWRLLKQHRTSLCSRCNLQRKIRHHVQLVHAKDSPSSGLGHRHDWENVVVWLSLSSTSAQALGPAVSQDGGYSKTTTPASSGTRPLVRYVSYWALDHQLIADDSVGGSQPLVAWESLTAAAQMALTVTDFESAKVPFKDSAFAAILARQRYDYIPLSIALFDDVFAPLFTIWRRYDLHLWGIWSFEIFSLNSGQSSARVHMAGGLRQL
ncbi:necrosis inducing protein-domain-containing protein [Coniochaeta sp. 2T2.1]|nr:necrosis inducing protein-domain-containing protein [Coniochaeta sp. 2T2.1]